MIVRISGEGQFDVPEQDVNELNDLDTALTDAVAAEDDAQFRTALTRLLGRVREVGTPLRDDELLPSEAILPGEGTSLSEVLDVLGAEGLIPG